LLNIIQKLFTRRCVAENKILNLFKGQFTIYIKPLQLSLPSPIAEVQRAGRYFSVRWHDWNNEQGVFARMSIASSHGARELKLPDGEERRLRIVQPLPPALIAVLQADKSSPAYIADEKLRAAAANSERAHFLPPFGALQGWRLRNDFQYYCNVLNFQYVFLRVVFAVASLFAWPRMVTASPSITPVTAPPPRKPPAPVPPTCASPTASRR
jgi:hypothetical protein